jgi:HSP20 family protein
MANQDLTPWRRSGLTPLARDPFFNFRREMDRLFDDFFTPAAEGRSFASAGEAAVRPMIDVDETEQAYTVTAELPGIAEQDIELNLRDNALTISGEKRSEHTEGEGGRRYTERSFGRFSRTIPLDTEVDAERVQATCRNGVLTVTLPKNDRAQQKNRRIEIRSDGGGASASTAESSPGQ